MRNAWKPYLCHCSLQIVNLASLYPRRCYMLPYRTCIKSRNQALHDPEDVFDTGSLVPDFAPLFASRGG